MRIKPQILLVGAVLILSGCGMTGSTSFRDMSTAYREVLEDYGNDNILLNIVRTSESMPVSFLDMPNVIGSGSIAAGGSVGATIISANPATVPGFFSGALGSSVAPSATLSASSAFNFTQSSLDNSSFMTAFLSELKPEAIQSLTNNTIGPKSILYTLAIDSLELRNSSNKTVARFVNDPFSPEYPKFQEALYRLIKGGLGTEVTMQQIPLSAPMSMETVNQNMRAMVEAYAQPGVMLLPATLPNGKAGYALNRIMPAARMCLNRQPDQEEFQDKFTSGAFCAIGVPGAPMGSVSTAPSPEQKTADKNKETLVIKLRSTRNIFDFLGALTILQQGANPKYVTIKTSGELGVATATDLSAAQSADNGAMPLFVINKNKSFGGRTLASVNYRGNSYSIPDENSGASRQVIVLLSQILTLNKVPGSIPASPAVLIH